MNIVILFKTDIFVHSKVYIHNSLPHDAEPSPYLNCSLCLRHIIYPALY